MSKKAFMDNITLLKHTIDEMRTALHRFDNLIAWAKMKFKAKKSGSVTFIKGSQKKVSFPIGGERMPTIKEQPVKIDKTLLPQKIQGVVSSICTLAQTAMAIDVV